jgi:hypothetical protein
MDGLAYWLALIPVENTGQSELDSFVNDQVRTARADLRADSTSVLETKRSA